MSKIYAGMIAYNEEWIIGCSLRSVYHHVDEIVVIDGSPYGPSADKTAQIARSIGPKVKVFSGTFEDPSGSDPEKIQRQVLLDRMEKSKNNWCVIVDADEVWDDENIGRLVNHLRHADEKTMMYAYPHIQFVRDCWHYYFGKSNELRYDKKKYCSRPKSHNTLRLMPGIKYFDYHNIGVSENFIKFRTVFDDISFFHYSWAVPKENFFYRMYWRFLFIHKKKPDEWEKYYKEVAVLTWERFQELKSCNEYEIKTYDGSQPKWIRPLIETIWKK